MWGLAAGHGHGLGDITVLNKTAVAICDAAHAVDALAVGHGLGANLRGLKGKTYRGFFAIRSHVLATSRGEKRKS